MMMQWEWEGFVMVILVVGERRNNSRIVVVKVGNCCFK
jgi:hypothetical protein